MQGKATAGDTGSKGDGNSKKSNFKFSLSSAKGKAKTIPQEPKLLKRSRSASVQSPEEVAEDEALVAENRPDQHSDMRVGSKRLFVNHEKSVNSGVGTLEGGAVAKKGPRVIGVAFVDIPPHVTKDQVIKVLKENLTEEYFDEVDAERVEICNAQHGQHIAKVLLKPNKSPYKTDEVKTAIQELDKKKIYMGAGYYATIDSLNDHGELNANPIFKGPFGAVKISEPTFNQPTSSVERATYVVKVERPQEKQELTRIHAVIEKVIKYGPGFEHLFMADERIRDNPEWAWLYDRTTKHGQYYFWRMLDMTQMKMDKVTTPFRPYTVKASSVSEDRTMLSCSSEFVPPPDLAYEFTTDLKDLVEKQDAGGNFLGLRNFENLCWLIDDLPTRSSEIMYKDVAPVTDFVYSMKSRGEFEEVADVLLDNCIRPRNLKSRWPNDPLPAYKVALRIVQDVLYTGLSFSNGTTVRHVFTQALKKKNVFGHMGKVVKDHGMKPVMYSLFAQAIQNELHRWQIEKLLVEENGMNIYEVLSAGIYNPVLSEEDQKIKDEKDKEKAQREAEAAVKREEYLKEHAAKQLAAKKAAKAEGKGKATASPSASPVETTLDDFSNAPTLTENAAVRDEAPSTIVSEDKDQDSAIQPPEWDGNDMFKF